MKSKLLFIFGIVAAHGAVGAGLMHDLSSAPREVSLTCAHIPAADPFFAPPRELFAASAIPQDAGDAMQP